MLSATAEYALGALTCLARRSGNVLLQGRALATELEAPANYLTKVLSVLRRGGFVEAVRGIGGGYRLARSPEKIALREVVELFDEARLGSGALLGCRGCSQRRPCAAHRRWEALHRAYLDFLATTTLSELGRCAGNASRPQEGDQARERRRAQ